MVDEKERGGRGGREGEEGHEVGVPGGGIRRLYGPCQDGRGPGNMPDTETGLGTTPGEWRCRTRGLCRSTGGQHLSSGEWEFGERADVKEGGACSVVSVVEIDKDLMTEEVIFQGSRP